MNEDGIHPGTRPTGSLTCPWATVSGVWGGVVWFVAELGCPVTWGELERKNQVTTVWLLSLTNISNTDSVLLL